MAEIKKRKIVFLTGTRADFGKLKSLMYKIRDDENFELHVFVTGMHMLTKYGYTCDEVEKSKFKNIYKFINQNANDSMDHILSKTISGLSDFIREIKPDMFVVHGDRVEALAGSAVGALNNILVGHIEGGEVSGTIDELIRHAVSKLSHVHFVSNLAAKARLAQLGERLENIHIIGSPDIDVMNSKNLPTIDEVKQYYGFNFNKYAILLFHPVTTELVDLQSQINIIINQVITSNLNYVVIYPNNDIGTNVIIDAYSRLKGLPQIRIYPSMRFEYFLTALKNSMFIIGNSSAGTREAPHYSVPAINLGTRQHNRVKCETVLNSLIDPEDIRKTMSRAIMMKKYSSQLFGDGVSDEKFHAIVKDPSFWSIPVQKYFVDLKN